MKLLDSLVYLLFLPFATQAFVAPTNRFSFQRGARISSNHATRQSPTPRSRDVVKSPVMQMQTDTQGESQGLNLKLIATNAANQAIIGSTIWTGGNGFEVLIQKAQFGLPGIVMGVLGVIPMLYLSRKIETSESYLVSGLNLSTNMAVLRLFGDTPKPISAGLIAAFLSGLTGVVEEVTFRGQLLPLFAAKFGNGDILTGAFLSSLLFAFLHTNPASFFRGDKDQILDNVVLLALQLVNGGFFAYLFLTTGNLAVPIIAHALYDFYTFYKTHMVDVAGQMEYAMKESLMPNISPALEQKWVQARGPDFVRGVQESFYLMDTNRDGVLSRKELRVALFSYGIILSQLQSLKVAREADSDQSGAIDLDEFLEYVGPTGSTREAVRNTLFGPL